MTRTSMVSLRPALLAGLAALALAGCSGGGGGLGSGAGGGGGGNGGPTVALNTFTAQGSDGGSATGSGNGSGVPLVIDGNQNGGVFRLNWQTSITNDDGAGERLALFLGDAAGNTDTAGGNAIQILGQNCDLNGLGSNDCPSTSGTAVPCQFVEASMEIDCPTNQGAPQQGINAFNVSQFLSNHSGLPGSYYLTLQACVVHDSQGNQSCDTKTLPVNLN